MINKNKDHKSIEVCDPIYMIANFFILNDYYHLPTSAIL